MTNQQAKLITFHAAGAKRLAALYGDATKLLAENPISEELTTSARQVIQRFCPHLPKNEIPHVIAILAAEARYPHQYRTPELVMLIGENADRATLRFDFRETMRDHGNGLCKGQMVNAGKDRDVQTSEVQDHQRLERLTQLLRDQPAGRLRGSPAEKVQSLLLDSWGSLGGSHQENTTTDKLAGRMEDLKWEPPFLCFRIERHGRTALGSSRAEIHGWSVNLETGTASCCVVGYRQVYPRAPRLNVLPLAENVAKQILAGRRSPNLRWSGTEKVRVIIGNIIPSEGPKETIQGRRRRFRKALELKLASLGWLPGTTWNSYSKSATCGIAHQSHPGEERATASSKANRAGRSVGEAVSP